MARRQLCVHRPGGLRRDQRRQRHRTVRSAGRASGEILVPAQKLIPEGQSSPLKISDHSWSKDRRKLLIFTNAKRVWRTNSRGDYWVLDLDDWTLRKLGGDAKPSTLMFAKFSPDGRRVAYLRDRNIYVQNLRTLKIRQLTRDGSETIINGTGDWVYEEEFGLRDGFQWSPDSRYIAYWQFDTSGVPGVLPRQQYE